MLAIPIFERPFFMNTIYIQLGSNVGERNSYIKESLLQIEQILGTIICESKTYESSPWGVMEQRNFLNKVISVKSEFSAKDVLKSLQKIEYKLGRKRTAKWGERTIDLDILFYNNETINTKELTIPHPHIQDRKFVLMPFAEMNGKFIHPTLKKDIFALLKECKDTEKVSVYEI